MRINRRSGFLKNLSHIIIASSFILNAVPRMVSSDGNERWFAPIIADPEGLEGEMSSKPRATLVLGFPFVYYSELGREFVRKEGDKIFWPSRKTTLANRFSFKSLLANVILASSVVASLLIASNRTGGSRRGETPAASQRLLTVD